MFSYMVQYSAVNMKIFPSGLIRSFHSRILTYYRAAEGRYLGCTCPTTVRSPGNGNDAVLF